MSATIKDLARETGLTAATISAYFNGASVRPYNKEKIERAIDKLGYIRNDYARALRTHRSMTVGVLIPEFASMFATQLVTEIEEALRLKRYGIIICDCRSNPSREREAVRFLQSKMVDGIIVIPATDSASSLSSAIQKKLPVVALDRYTESRDISHVIVSNRKAGREAVQKMLSEGKKKIAVIHGDENLFTARERLAGYRDAMERAGEGTGIAVPGGNSVQGGYEAAKKLLSGEPGLQGIFATNYEMSIGAAIALKETGKTIGGDFAFTGFDSVQMLPVLCPGMHMVVQPIRELGMVAAETLLAMINGGPIRNIVLDCKVI